MALVFSAGAGRVFAAEDEPRFSSTLTTAQRAEAGFAKLSDDNIAVIDALVRADEAALRRHGRPAMSSARFSQRRSAHETEIAGLAKLTAEQRDHLDELIARRTSPVPELTAEVGGPPLRRGMEERSARPPGVEIHGSVSLTYGWSKAGNIRGGEMVVSAQDPSHRIAVTVGYSEYRGKGLTPYYDTADDFYRYRPTPPPSIVEP